MSKQHNDKNIELLIWDTAGQEMYRSMIKMYYRGIHAAIIVFDLCERKSFESVEHWFKDIREK